MEALEGGGSSDKTNVIRRCPHPTRSTSWWSYPLHNAVRSAILHAIIWALPWVATALILVEFALVDELLEPRVRRVMIGVGVLLLLVTAIAVWRTPTPGPVQHFLVASGPLVFFVLAELLRRAVLRLKGGEPVLLFTPDAWRGGSRRAFFDPNESRRVSGWDHAYTLLVGVGMLLAALPAIGEIVQRRG